MDSQRELTVTPLMGLMVADAKSVSVNDALMHLSRFWRTNGYTAVEWSDALSYLRRSVNRPGKSTNVPTGSVDNDHNSRVHALLDAVLRDPVTLQLALRATDALRDTTFVWTVNDGECQVANMPTSAAG
jgi:hypothetical protein